MDTELRTLTNDSDISEMLKCVHKHRIIYVYVEHGTSYLEPSSILGYNTEVEDQDNTEGETHDDTKDESHNESKDDDQDNTELENQENTDVEDEDKTVDQEHIVDEVEVNMHGFRFEVEVESVETMQPKLNMTENDLEVIDFDSFESDVEADDESERRKGLRKLRKEAAKTTLKNSFFVGKEFANRDVAKEMVRAHAGRQGETFRL